MTDDVIEVEAEIIEKPELDVSYTPATIEDNIAALDAYVDSELKYFVGTKIDPSDGKQVKLGRDAMAALNKLKEPIEAERKRIKREYEAPLKAFEARVKEITKKIDDARDGIKAQVDEADRLFKESRYALLAEEYVAAAGPMADVISIDALMDPAWLRRSTSEVKATNDLVAKAVEAKQGYDTLMARELNHKDEVVKAYAETLDIIKAFKVEEDLNERDQEMAEFKARQEAMEAPRLRPAPKAEAKDEAEETTHRFSVEITQPEFETTDTEARALANHFRLLGISGKIHRIS